MTRAPMPKAAAAVTKPIVPPPETNLGSDGNKDRDKDKKDKDQPTEMKVFSISIKTTCP